MAAEKIMREIERFEGEISALKGRLKEIQGACEHRFVRENGVYEICEKCLKVDVLYY